MFRKIDSSMPICHFYKFLSYVLKGMLIMSIVEYDVGKKVFLPLRYKFYRNVDKTSIFCFIFFIFIFFFLLLLFWFYFFLVCYLLFVYGCDIQYGGVLINTLLLCLWFFCPTREFFTHVETSLLCYMP